MAVLISWSTQKGLQDLKEITFCYHFYVKTIGHLVPVFFIHNILYTIGVPPSKISQIKENKGTLLY